MIDNKQLPKILGDDQLGPTILWVSDNMCGEDQVVPLPAGFPKKESTWQIGFTSQKAAQAWEGEIYPTTLDELLHSAKSEGDDGVLIIDESYRVIDTYTVRP